MMNEFIRNDLKELKPYHVQIEPHELKLDANESPYDMTREIKDNLIEWIQKSENFKLYPDTDSIKLREILAKYWKVTKDNVICGVGSDQLIDCILKLVIEPEDKVLVPNPSFSMYKIITKLNHGIPVQFELDDNFDYILEDIIEKYKQNEPKAIMICNPNNPTGNIIAKSDIIRLLDIVKCPVIVDEAYGEFYGDSMIDEINNFDNLIVLRTFSKAYGLAGLRVGYGIANSNLIEYINITKPPYNLNTFTQLAAIQIMDNIEEYKELIENIKQEKDWLYKELSKINDIKCYKSEANFILIKSKIDNLSQLLCENGILVRGFSNNDNRLSNCIRVSVGKRKDNEKLIKTLESIIY